MLLGIKYDAEKEEKSLQDIKQKELCRIEEALQKAAEKGKLILLIKLTVNT
jgi:vacuolar protein sorting-associated protein 13A/C